MSREATVWFRKLRVGLTPLEHRIGSELAFRADDRGMAWPSVATISHATEVPARTVHRALGRLEQKGIIRRAGRHQRCRTVVWEITIDLKPEVIPDPTPPDEPDYPCQSGMTDSLPKWQGGVCQSSDLTLPNGQNDTATAADNTNYITLTSETHESHSLARARDAEVSFSDFMAAYPRPERPGAARRAWTQAIREISPADLLRAVQAYPFAAKSHHEARYIPHAVNWLRDECWLEVDLATPAIDPALAAAGLTYADLHRCTAVAHASR